MPSTSQEKEESMTKTLNLRARPSDLEAYEKAAQLEGFTDRTAWVHYHLRRQAKQTIRDNEGSE